MREMFAPWYPQGVGEQRQASGLLLLPKAGSRGSEPAKSPARLPGHPSSPARARGRLETEGY